MSQAARLEIENLANRPWNWRELLFGNPSVFHCRGSFGEVLGIERGIWVDEDEKHWVEIYSRLPKGDYYMNSSYCLEEIASDKTWITKEEYLALRDKKSITSAA